MSFRLENSSNGISICTLITHDDPKKYIEGIPFTAIELPSNVAGKICLELDSKNYVTKCLQAENYFGSALGADSNYEWDIIEDCVIANYVSDHVKGYVDGLFGDIAKYTKHLLGF